MPFLNATMAAVDCQGVHHGLVLNMEATLYCGDVLRASCRIMGFHGGLGVRVPSMLATQPQTWFDPRRSGLAG